MPVKGAQYVLAMVVVLGLTAGLTFGYEWLLGKELAGYYGIKEHQLQLNKERRLRRLQHPGLPAQREKDLAALEQFRDLPEASDIHSELQLVKIWEKLLVLFFGAYALALTVYLAFRRRKPIGRRLAVFFLVLAAGSQALPLLVMPAEVLLLSTLFRRIGLPLIAVAGIFLLLEGWRDLSSARQAAISDEKKIPAG